MLCDIRVQAGALLLARAKDLSHTMAAPSKPHASGIVPPGDVTQRVGPEMRIHRLAQHLPVPRGGTLR